MHRRTHLRGRFGGMAERLNSFVFLRAAARNMLLFLLPPLPLFLFCRGVSPGPFFPFREPRWKQQFGFCLTVYDNPRMLDQAMGVWKRLAGQALAREMRNCGRWLHICIERDMALCTYIDGYIYIYIYSHVYIRIHYTWPCIWSLLVRWCVAASDTCINWSAVYKLV